MDNYDEGDVMEVEKEVEELRSDALKKVQMIYPDIEFVVDRHTIDDYTYRTWDYPGKWYMGFTLPDGFRKKEEVIDDIVKETIRYFTEKKEKEAEKKKGFFRFFKKK